MAIELEAVVPLWVLVGVAVCMVSVVSVAGVLQEAERRRKEEEVRALVELYSEELIFNTKMNRFAHFGAPAGNSGTSFFDAALAAGNDHEVYESDATISSQQQISRKVSTTSRLRKRVTFEMDVTSLSRVAPCSSA